MRIAEGPGSTTAALRRYLTLLLALASPSMVSGCAGWNSVGENRTGLSGVFWNRSDKTAQAPGYDLYADTGAIARPQAAEEVQLASKDKKDTKENKAQRKTPLAEEPVPDLVAQNEATRAQDSTARKKRAKTTDTSIRVTLGRPESLPTVNDSPDAGGPVLASAEGTNWQRSNSAVDSETELRRDKSRAGSQRKAATADLAEKQPATAREDRLQDVLAAAKKRLSALSTYQVNITRTERVGGSLQPEEEVVLSIRRNPKAVRLEWAKGPSKGREVIYSAAINDRMMYVNSGNSALPLPRMTIPVDSPLALRNSRHPISEAGFDTILDNLFKFLEPQSTAVASDGKLVYKGVVRAKGLDHPCYLVERVTPKGETWQVHLDTRTFMPAMVSAVQTSSGVLIERYTYRDLRPNPEELASTSAFDPDKRWGESKGWLSRIARGGAPAPDANSRQTTTR